jgi:glycosyltransferase involved in cell wall biosynthesis
VADFRDPWMGNPYMNIPTTFHRRLNQQLEQSVFIEADRVILNTARSRQYYTQKYSTLSAEKFSTIPNGYDQSDLPSTSQDVQMNSVFTIAHLGSLYQNTRSSEYFLAALREAFESGKLPSDKIQVRFIGNIDKETQGLVSQFKLGGNVELLGYLPHQQALSQLFAADLLLLIPSYGAGSDLFVPAKLYEYLASRKPILCLADHGDSANLILKTQAGSIVPPTDTGKIIEHLVSLFQIWQNGNLFITPDQKLIQTFERRQLTGQLAKIFNELTGKTV